MYKSTTRIDGMPLIDGLRNVSYLRDRYTKERSGDFTNTTLSGKLASTALDTLLLFPGETSNIGVDGTDTAFDISLNELPELRKGRENSRAEVKFGQLHIVDDSSAPISELVAVKSMHRLTAPREFHAGQAVNARMGETRAFEPVGYTRGENDRINYLTRYEHSVISLDNVLWNESSSPEQREKAFAFAGVWLANLHNHDIKHGDAQAKNIAYDASQRPRYIDLESAMDIGTSTNLDPRIMRLLDISDLFNPTYMPPTTLEEEMVFAESYLDHQDNRRMLDGQDIAEVIAVARKHTD